MLIYFFTQHDCLCLSFRGQAAHGIYMVCEMTAVFRMRRNTFHATVRLNQVT